MVVRIYKAIQKECTIKDCEHIDENICNGEVLWPEVRPLRWLEKVRSVMADYRFDLQYNNDASKMLGGRYLRKWIKYIDYSLIDFSKYRGIQYADPATSIENKADDFAIATGGIDENRDLVVFDAEFRKVAPADHGDYMTEIYDKWQNRGLKISQVYIEEVGPQQGTSQRLIHDLRSVMPLEANKVTKASGSKDMRIDNCMPFIKSGQTKFLGYLPPDSIFLDILPTEGLLEFIKQYELFPRSKDDVLDAVAGLITKALESAPAASRTTNLEEIIKESENKNPFEREIERASFGTISSLMRLNSGLLFRKKGGKRGIFR